MKLGRLEEDIDAVGLGEGFSGFRVGIRGQFDDYRDSAVRGNDLNVGLLTDGRLFIGRLEADAARVAGTFSELKLRFHAEPDGSSYQATLEALDASGALLARMSRSDIPPEWLEGGLALVSSSGEVTEDPDNLAGDPRNGMAGEARTGPRRDRTVLVPRLEGLGLQDRGP